MVYPTSVCVIGENIYVADMAQGSIYVWVRDLGRARCVKKIGSGLLASGAGFLCAFDNSHLLLTDRYATAASVCTYRQAGNSEYRQAR